MEKAIKIILVLLLLACLLDMPYSYFMIVRFLATCSFLYFSYNSRNAGNNSGAILYLVLALLFQPFFKIALGRFVWNLVDVVVAILLMISIIPKMNSKSTINIRK
jgi:hypothetical protein